MSTVNITSNMASNVNSTDDIMAYNGPLVDEARRELMEIYIYPFVLVIFFMIVGFIGNTIVIYIFTAKWKLTKTTIFILTLAGVDLMSCVINMPTEAAILWNPMNFDYEVICKISRFTTFIASASSSFVLIAISIDRYLMVCRPFLGRELGVKYAKRTCLIAVLLGIISTWPSLIFYGTYTYQVEKTDSETGKVMKIESKTCLISNFYVEHYKLPAGFYFFLFGGHIIMFVILTMVYLLIGRSLFMSTSTDVSNEKRHSLKYFGISMMSAFTGTVPNSPADNRDRVSWGSRSSRAVSLENINRLDQSLVNNLARQQPRKTNETTVSIVLNDLENENKEQSCSKKEDIETNIEKRSQGNMMKDNICNTNSSSLNLDNICSVSNQECDDRLYITRNNLCVQQATSDDSASDTSFNSPEKKPDTKLLYLNIGKRDKDRTKNGRLSSGSTTSTNCLTPVTPMSPVTPDSVSGVLYRSQSIESRARINRIISDELRHTEVKEFSLRRNTLIMRMVTIAFVVSFLPYLVIVIIRYSNPDIPTKLSKVEQILYHVFLRTYFVSSMINPFIYGFLNIEFRSKLKEMFCNFCTRHNIHM
ncbi:dopamine D2-like receptor [Mercenaria mercenaria]|uniref:dopamine D2-like receptor n=1 Tax=Mercenaria mercenaria TaxID=6596 RepID=UPI00234E3924|nr:dopamine D2-like receptor [Mercenaria mercenaria]XP_045182983.2 dopamine D2-like receptor [Mercenaria mercenaria]